MAPSSAQASDAAASVTFAEDAATAQPPPRVIDENTDMSTLTDQEIMKLMEGMDHTEDVLTKVCTLTGSSRSFVLSSPSHLHLHGGV